MNAAEFRCLREFLGLPVNWVAEQLYVKSDTIRRWERDHGQISPFARTLMRGWVSQANRVVGALTIELTKRKSEINAPQDDCPTEMLDRMPASWHRMVAARVAERTGLEIVWHQGDSE